MICRGPGFSCFSPTPSPVRKLSLFSVILVCCRSSFLTGGGGGGVGEEPNHTTVRQPGPLIIIQYSLRYSYSIRNHLQMLKSYFLTYVGTIAESLKLKNRTRKISSVKKQIVFCLIKETVGRLSSQFLPFFNKHTLT